MKTNNYKFDLMYQGQDHKDIVYNETILKLDANLNLSVVDFVENQPEFVSYGQRFIITSGENKNKICYFAHNTKGAQYILPYDNMIVFIIKDNCFVRFSDNSWQKIVCTFDGQGALPDAKFTGIKDKFVLPKKCEYCYLYLEDNCVMDFDEIAIPSFMVLIKQNYENVFQVKWPVGVLWPNNEPKQITSITNSIDLFKFYKIPESQHFLAEVVNQNYQY